MSSSAGGSSGGGGGSGGPTHAFTPIASSPSEGGGGSSGVSGARSILGRSRPVRHDTAADIVHDEEEEVRDEEAPHSASQVASPPTRALSASPSSLRAAAAGSGKTSSSVSPAHRALGTGASPLHEVELKRLRAPASVASTPTAPPSSLPEALEALAAAQADIAALQARLDALQADATANAREVFGNKGLDHSAGTGAGGIRGGIELSRSQSHTRNALERAYENGMGDGSGAPVSDDAEVHLSLGEHGMSDADGGAIEAPGHTMSLQQYFATPFWVLLLRRLPWLVGLLLLQSFSASILHGYDEYLSAHLLFSFFIPMIVGTGGNAGNQCSVMVTRALALGMSDREVLRVVRKEAPTAVVTSIILGLVAFLRVVIEYPADATEAAAIAITLGVSILLSIALGILFSYGIGKMDRCDPADGAAPLLTTISDLIGIGLLCGIATSMVP